MGDMIRGMAKPSTDCVTEAGAVDANCDGVADAVAAARQDKRQARKDKRSRRKK